MASPSGSEGPRSRKDLLDAVAVLGDESSARALGAREIARQAQVNHSLIFRHFGSVDGLVAEVLASRLAVVAAEISRCDDPGEAIGILIDALRGSRRLLMTIIESEGACDIAAVVDDLVGSRISATLTGPGASSQDDHEHLALMARAAIGMAVVPASGDVAAAREAEIEALLGIVHRVPSAPDDPHVSDEAVLRSPTQHNSGAEGKPV